MNVKKITAIVLFSFLVLSSIKALTDKERFILERKKNNLLKSFNANVYFFYEKFDDATFKKISENRNEIEAFLTAIVDTIQRLGTGSMDSRLKSAMKESIKEYEKNMWKTLEEILDIFEVGENFRDPKRRKGYSIVQGKYKDFKRYLTEFFSVKL